jgi:hypothetical protein
MTIFMKALAGASAVALLAAGAQAQTIDFGGLPGNNGDAFAGPYVEDGYSTSATGGQVFEGHIFGNPDPSLVVGNVFGGGNLGVIETSRAATFSLASFDLVAQNGVGNYVVEGFLGAASVYSFAGAVGSPFQTIGGNAGVIDRVRFTLSPTGTSMNIDNLVFRDAAVPEPASWAMMIAGFGLAGHAVRRRKIAYALA